MNRAHLDISHTLHTDINTQVANVIEESTLQNIRDGQHRDAYGNVIGKDHAR